MNDGKLLMSGYHSGIKLVDFEHAHDRCEILCVKKTIKGRKSVRQNSAIETSQN